MLLHSNTYTQSPTAPLAFLKKFFFKKKDKLQNMEKRGEFQHQENGAKNDEQRNPPTPPKKTRTPTMPLPHAFENSS